MNSLKDRLLQAEDDFISSLAAGDGAVSSFATRWELLLQDVDSAMESSCLDPETATLVHTTALRIATYVDASTEIYESYNTLTSELVEQVDHLMSELTLNDNSLAPVSVASSQASSPSSLSSPLSIELPNHIGTAPATGRKRCRSSSSPRKAPKRQCCSVSANLSKIDAIQAPCNRASGLLASTQPHGPTRKRRLSDADIPVSVKPGKRPYLGPRLHAVSDSYLSPHGPVTRKAHCTEFAQHARSERSVDHGGLLLSAPLDVLSIPITTFYTDYLSQEKPSGEVELSSMLLDSSSFDELPSPSDDVDAWLTSLFNSDDVVSELPKPLPPLRDPMSFSWTGCDSSNVEDTLALTAPFPDAPVGSVTEAISFSDALALQQAPPYEDIVDWSTVFEYLPSTNSEFQPHLRAQSPGDSSESSTDTEDDCPTTPTMSSTLSMPSQYTDTLVLPVYHSDVKLLGMEVVDPLSALHSQSSSRFTLC